jgi:hypothetical protein
MVTLMSGFPWRMVPSDLACFLLVASIVSLCPSLHLYFSSHQWALFTAMTTSQGRLDGRSFRSKRDIS